MCGAYIVVFLIVTTFGKKKVSMYTCAIVRLKYVMYVCRYVLTVHAIMCNRQ